MYFNCPSPNVGENYTSSTVQYKRTTHIIVEKYRINASVLDKKNTNLYFSERSMVCK